MHAGYSSGEESELEITGQLVSNSNNNSNNNKDLAATSNSAANTNIW